MKPKLRIFCIILMCLCSGFLLHVGGVDYIYSRLKTDTNFGKTHFIVGYKHDSKRHENKQCDTRKHHSKRNIVLGDGKQDSALPSSSITLDSKQELLLGKRRGQELSADTARQELTDTVVAEPVILFAPDDNIREHLLDLIEHEQERIAVAVFVFSDKLIAQALIKAAQRGVLVEVITDSSGLKDRYNKIHVLCDAAIPVFVYNTQHGKPGLSTIMHHKFALFGKNKNGQSYVWAGSCNFTRAACESNQEYAMILAGKMYSERFMKQFDLLKKRSYSYTKRKRS